MNPKTEYDAVGDSVLTVIGAQLGDLANEENAS